MTINGYSHNFYQINTADGGGEGRVHSERGNGTLTNRALNLFLFPNTVP